MGKLSKQNPDQTLIEMWLHNRPDSTQEAYRRDVDNFFEFVGKPLQQVTLEELQAYSTSLDEQDLKPSSIRRKLNAIKSLFTFATKLNYTRFNVAAALRIPKGNRLLSGRILKQIEVLKLINHPELSARDRALLKLLYATGMRVSEVCNLRWCDFVERDSGEVQVSILGKGDKQRVVLVPLSVWMEVEALRADYLSDTPVFLSVRDKKIDRTMVHLIIKEAAKLANLDPKISCHWLRHAHAQHSLTKGAPIHLVRDTLGHSNISVTNVYLESNPEDSSSKYLGF
ncbi:tyrosine-type recombinase/integrase [Nostoc sp. CENA67]|uniref:Tyrosine-type recombinase/integrase n=1 Tax=Amazonocrinis nigriterrae CENA67 TaxID=2794033 RepID=A0A8J7HVR2_9NOST|nr:tyrosine-type recombinase/integrase [Amazonocrinis nigriterrae]MBH8566741.1 tyrosine-type recombinase/integrase [Amazonocrinis nigriterrae CENA67]